MGSLLYFIISIWMMLPSGNNTKGTLIWNDEFENTGLPDAQKWRYQVGDGCPQVCGWGNNELQYYTAYLPENARVENGHLIIEAHKKDTLNKTFTSARLVTNQASWQYGYVEVRAKLPQGRGTWPAIWMLPDSARYGTWPHSGEIDIMEHVGYDQGVIHGTVHTGAFNHIKGTEKGKQFKVPSFHDEFHVYAIHWTEKKIRFLIDDIQYHEFENDGSGTEAWPFNQPFHLILNLAVGGNWGGKHGVDERIWPQKLIVDYVRVYQ